MEKAKHVGNSSGGACFCEARNHISGICKSRLPWCDRAPALVRSAESTARILRKRGAWTSCSAAVWPPGSRQADAAGDGAARAIGGPVESSGRQGLSRNKHWSLRTWCHGYRTSPPATAEGDSERGAQHFWVPVWCLVLGIKRSVLGLVCKSGMGKKRRGRGWIEGSAGKSTSGGRDWSGAGSVLGEGVDFAEVEPRTGCIITQLLGSF